MIMLLLLALPIFLLMTAQEDGVNRETAAVKWWTGMAALAGDHTASRIIRLIIRDALLKWERIEYIHVNRGAMKLVQQTNSKRRDKDSGGVEL